MYLPVIRNIKLPPAWSIVAESDWRHQWHGQVYVHFAPSDVERTRSGCDTVLAFYPSGLLSLRDAAKFMELLAKPPHVLSIEELESISAVLHNYGREDLFNLSSLETVNINERRVLVAQGIWSETGSYGMLMLIAQSDDGEIVSEITFRTLPEKFENYMPEVDAAIRSIEWI